MTAKEYLLTYSTAYREAQAIEEEMTRLRLKYSLPSAIRYDDMPAAHNTERDLSDYAAKMEELTSALVDKYVQCIAREADIIDRLYRMGDSKEAQKERDVLRYRYTHVSDKGKLMKWAEVADRMGYERETVTRIHGKALQHFPMA